MRRLIIVVGVVLVSLSAILGAQTQQPPTFVQVTTTTVKGSAVSDYEDYIKKLVAARDKVGLQAPARVTVYSVGMGGPSFTYTIVTPFDKWADVDAATSNLQVLTKAYGELEATKLIKMVRSSIDAQRSEVLRTLPELSTNPKVFSPPAAFVIVTRTEIEPSMTQEYQSAVSKLKAAAEKAGDFPTTMRYVVVHGATPTYLSAQPFNKYAERDEPRNLGQAVVKAFSQSESNLIFGTISKATRHRESYVIAYRPELSWSRKTTTTSQQE